MTLALRRMRRGEEQCLYEVLRAAVHGGTARHYDEAQRRAWAPDRPFDGWSARLQATECFVAVADGRVVGFLAVTPAGHVEFAYVVLEMHGSGIARRLLDRAEREMRLLGVAAMSTEASLVAAPFFARQGWRHDGEETVERHGQVLRRVRMSKRLSPQEESRAS